MSRTTEIDIGNAAGRPIARPAGAAGRLWSRALARLLRLSLHETRVATRGFSVDSPQVVQRLEDIGASFVHGYNSALRSASLDELVSALKDVPLADAGFAFEGAAMGLALSDWMTPGRGWFEAFVAGPAQHHEYMAWVGLGWSFARLPVSPLRVLSRYRTLNKWLALDGYGFHEGYFGWRRTVLRQWRPRALAGDAARVFDQGLGRSLWFVRGASPGNVAEAINGFDRTRRHDLWAGVGLAATYAGGASRDGLLELKNLAGANFQALAQGVVFAAQASRRAGNAVPHNELACTSLLGLSLGAAADIAVECLPDAGDEIAIYQRWRDAVQARF